MNSCTGRDAGFEEMAPFENSGRKKVTIFGLLMRLLVLHIVFPSEPPRYYLLLTGIHRFLAPLFTSIPSLFETLNPPLPP